MTTTLDPSPKDGATADSKGMGEPSDALVALVGELKKAPEVAKPDKDVAKAVATGWHARELLGIAMRPDTQAPGARTAPPTAAAFPALARVVETLEQILLDEVGVEQEAPRAVAVSEVAAFVPDANGTPSNEFLKRMSKLSGFDQLQVALGQLAGDLRALETAVSAGGQSTKGAAATLIAIHTAPGERVALARRFGSEVAQTLFAADYRLGKAYAIGWDLASLVDPALEELTTKGFTARLEDNLNRDENHNGPLTERLDDLASVLPPNAAHAVGRSILNWQEATDGTLVETKPEDVRRQVQTWRALLTGERAAKDYLLSDDLIRTATSSAGRLGKAIIKAAWTWIPILVLAGGAAALSIWVMQPGGDATNSETIAGLTGLLASIGVTWKAIGATLGSSLSKAARPIWDSETDAAIAERITRFNGEGAAKSFR